MVGYMKKKCRRLDYLSGTGTVHEVGGAIKIRNSMWELMGMHQMRGLHMEMGWYTSIESMGVIFKPRFAQRLKYTEDTW